MKYFGITDRGKLRATNQDSYVIASNRKGDVFAMVCDGIGGGKGGDVASQLAVYYFSTAFSLNNGFEDQDAVRVWLSKSITGANKEIFETGKLNEELKGMGTTLSGVLISNQGTFVVNVGDSRTYGCYEDGTMKQLTRDHTLVNDMILHGELTPEQAKDFPKKNVLTNALGVWEKTQPDIIPLKEEGLAGFLLCSDGLHGYVNEEVIREIVDDREYEPALRVRRLYNEAMNAGGYDNITAILIDLEEE